MSSSLTCCWPPRYWFDASGNWAMHPWHALALDITDRDKQVKVLGFSVQYEPAFGASGALLNGHADFFLMPAS